MTIEFIKDRPPFKEGEVVEVSKEVAEDYEKESVAIKK